MRSSLVCSGGRVNSKWRVARCKGTEASVEPLQFIGRGTPIGTVPWLSRGERTAGTSSEDVLRLAVEGLTDHAVVTLDPHGVITFWNAGAEHLFGWRSEQAVRVHVSSLLGPGGQDAGIGTTDLEEAKRQGSVTATRRMNHQDGSTRDVRTTILALRNDDRCAGVWCRGASAVRGTGCPPITWLGRARRRRHGVDGRDAPPAV